MGKLFIFTILFLQLAIIGAVLSKPLGEEETHEVKPSGKVPAQFADLEDEYNDEDDDDDDDDDQELCAICHDDFTQEAPVDLECQHKYHLTCLETFYDFKGDLQCFLCKKDLRTKDGLDINEFIYTERAGEVARNKMKIGVLAGYKPKPSQWEIIPRNWQSPGIYW